MQDLGGVDAQQVEVVEVGPRDGLQNEAALLDTRAKVAYIEALITAGLRRIEAVGFVHPGRVPQMADAEAVLGGGSRPSGVRYAGLVVNRRGLDRVLTEAVREVTAIPMRFHFHNTRNTGYANALAAVESGAAALDASSGGIGGCPFAPAATGNIATEDLAYALRRTGVETGINLGRALAAADYVGERLGHPGPALLGRAGDFPPS